MERKRFIQRGILAYIKTTILITLIISLFSGCSKKNTMSSCTVSITCSTGSFATKSIDPDENKISDINLIVFDEYGRTETALWMNKNADCPHNLILTSGKRYRLIAIVNFGYRISVLNSTQLENLTCHLAYPDEYRNGIPMYSDTGYIQIRDGQAIKLDLIRLMSKISIRVDRSQLSDDVDMNVAGIRIGNCPRSMYVFKESSISSADDCFPLGFNKTDEECTALNRMEHNNLSFAVSLYMFENMQGQFSDQPITDDSEKVFDTYDPRKEICSYIEIDLDYQSSTHVSSEGFLKYRFYLGENRNNLDVERNCHYQITITPKDDGLRGDGWRVDKNAITSIKSDEDISFTYYPDSYIRGNIGDKIHIGCIFTPQDTPFDVGEEYMKYDKEQGIYDYVIDEDGHGAVITLTGPGAGLIYMSAGAPINDSALWFIEVNMPNAGT